MQNRQISVRNIQNTVADFFNIKVTFARFQLSDRTGTCPCSATRRASTCRTVFHW